MVEGPGCKVKGEKLKPRIKGQVVKSISGNKATMKKKLSVAQVAAVTTDRRDVIPVPAESQFSQLLGETIVNVQTLGKEMFIFFHHLEVCLRIHFLMSGGFRVNGEKIDGDGGGESKTPTLVLGLSNDRVVFNLSACDIFQSSECWQKISDLQTLDICYESFNHTRAVELVSAQSDRMACDVLLDQAILPGVGNIIKNEALFDSGIRPNTKVRELTSEHISHLVKMTRDFSMVFYKCRKTNKPLTRHLKIYNKSVCRQCGGKVTTTRMGEDSPRMTSYCPVCQVNNLRATRTLPSKNSLLGWVTTSSDPDSSKVQTEWTCTVCTLVNMSTRRQCEVCLSANPHIPSSAPPGPKRTLPDKDSKDVSLPNAKRLKTTPAVSPSQQSENQPSPQTGGPRVTKPPPSQPPKVQGPRCMKHSTICLMKRVHKAGANLHRMFWSCPDRTCNFFKWADEKFPECEAHGRRTLLRTVLKEGNNNGRKFFCCSLDKKKQCGFFQWADNY